MWVDDLERFGLVCPSLTGNRSYPHHSLTAKFIRARQSFPIHTAWGLLLERQGGQASNIYHTVPRPSSVNRPSSVSSVGVNGVGWHSTGLAYNAFSVGVNGVGWHSAGLAYSAFSVGADGVGGIPHTACRCRYLAGSCRWWTSTAPPARHDVIILESCALSCRALEFGGML